MNIKENAIENDTFLIRQIASADKANFMRIHIENSQLARAYEEKKFYEYVWDTSVNSDDEINMMIIKKMPEKHVGNCSFQKLDTDTIEIGMDIDKSFQNQGIGTAVLLSLIDYLRKNEPDKRHVIKTKSTNLPCQKMIVKAGGIKIGEERTEFVTVMEEHIASLESYGLTEEAREAREILDRYKDICTYVYEFRA